MADKPLRIKVSTCDIPPYRDPAVMILIDQLKEIDIAAELEPVDTVQWYPKVQRRDYTVGLNLTGTLVDDLDAMLNERSGRFCFRTDRDREVPYRRIEPLG